MMSFDHEGVHVTRYFQKNESFLNVDEGLKNKIQQQFPHLPTFSFQ